MQGNLNLSAMSPSEFVVHVRSVGIHAVCEATGSKAIPNASLTRQIGNLCEHVFGREHRNEYLAEFFTEVPLATK